MKKKVLLKETELNELVPKLLEDVIKEYKFTPNNDNGGEQLELDFGVDPEEDTILSLMEEKYEEISAEIRNELQFIKNSGWNDTVYDSLESIHSDKIFPLWRQLDSLGKSYEPGRGWSLASGQPSKRLEDVIDKFNALEEVLVSCLEIYKEWKSLNEEFNNSIQELNGLLGE